MGFHYLNSHSYDNLNQQLKEYQAGKGNFLTQSQNVNNLNTSKQECLQATSIAN